VQTARPAPAPANGGSVPAAQASGAKQGVNGKEDDEDWWTE
jgi:hypothetical protein